MTAVVCVAPWRMNSQPRTTSASESTMMVTGVISSAARRYAGGSDSTNTCKPKCAPRRTATAAPRKTSHMNEARAISSYQTNVRPRM